MVLFISETHNSVLVILKSCATRNHLICQIGNGKYRLFIKHQKVSRGDKERLERAHE